MVHAPDANERVTSVDFCHPKPLRRYLKKSALLDLGDLKVSRQFVQLLLSIGGGDLYAPYKVP